jgi:pimeloyl-ACP methyl ester carboxylesterase
MAVKATEKAMPNLPETQFYQWQTHRCAYEVWSTVKPQEQTTPLLLIHPIGVGLSRRFWHRFCQTWIATDHTNSIYNPDLLGCGESAMPKQAYRSEVWAEQLQHFIQTVIQEPVIIVVQGALFPVAISLFQSIDSRLIRGMILAGPPAWQIMINPTAEWQQQLIWKLLSSPVGNAFYRYARRRKFLQSFSDRQLFAEAQAVDPEWLDTLEAGAANLDSRHAVFSFLAGFWRKDYAIDIANLTVPVLVAIGEQASSISRTGKGEPPEQRLGDYLSHLSQGQGMELDGRNVLPYESTSTFVTAIAPFVHQVEIRSHQQQP